MPEKIKHCTMWVLPIISALEIEINAVYWKRDALIQQQQQQLLQFFIVDLKQDLVLDTIYMIYFFNKPIFFTLQPHDAYKMAKKNE